MPDKYTQQIGQDAPNRDTEPLVRGRGQYTDDVTLTNALVLYLLRSPIAGAKIRVGPIDDALAMPGIVAVHLGPDVTGLGALPINQVLPLVEHPVFPILAQDHVQAIGQPVAAILARTMDQAQDAAELIQIEFEDSLAAPYPPTAQKQWKTTQVDDAFARATHVVHVNLHHPVLAPSPMEPRSIAVRYDPVVDGVTLWQSTQTPHRTRSALSHILAVDPTRIRVIAPDVGGAFGMKGSVYPEEVLAVWAALRHQRPVRWTATRSEEFLSATHGRGLSSRGRLALDKAGRFLALEAHITAPLGHWVPNSGLIPAWNAARMLPTGYDIPELDITTTAHLSAHPPRGIYRGAGRPEANALMERLVDQAAQTSGIDPIAIRHQNLLTPDRFPHSTPTGNRLDSGDYPACLDTLRTTAAYEAAVQIRDARRAKGSLVGIGIAFYVEPSGEGWESARVTLTKDGRAEIASGSSAQGQSRVTAFTQIAADALYMAPGAITVTFGDTEICPEGIGALASRSTAIGGSAVLSACQTATKRLQDGASLPITVDTRYENDGQAWGYGAYMAQVSVDRDTGMIALDRLSCVDDTGTMINPTLVKAQIIGGVAQGMGEALMEEVQFDSDGQLLTGSFMDYAMPRATDMPPIDIHSMQTPSPFNLLGAKGVGEAGTIGAPAAILNAALDALRPVGVTDLTMPLTPCKVWQAMQNAYSGT